jgi:hypothetical protein
MLRLKSCRGAWEEGSEASYGPKKGGTAALTRVWHPVGTGGRHTLADACPNQINTCRTNSVDLGSI